MSSDEKEVALDGKNSQEVQETTTAATVVAAGTTETTVEKDSPLLTDTTDNSTNQIGEEEKLVMVKTEPNHNNSNNKSDELHSMELLKKLEGILHPQVRAMEQEFLYRAREQAHRIAILDIPLLFETGEESRCDYIAVVTAPKLIQAWRVLRRPGMSLHKLNIILSRQMGDAEKRSRADFVVHTGFGKWVSGLQWKNILKRLMHSAISSSNAQN